MEWRGTRCVCEACSEKPQQPARVWPAPKAQAPQAEIPPAAAMPPAPHRNPTTTPKKKKKERKRHQLGRKQGGQNLNINFSETAKLFSIGDNNGIKEGSLSPIVKGREGTGLTTEEQVCARRIPPAH